MESSIKRSWCSKVTFKENCDHLHNELVRQGYVVFRDEEDIDYGDPLWPTLQKAIDESKISIIVFSKAYAASKWCLNELLTIMKRHKEEGRRFLPVFYHVEPTDVRNQTGTFGEPFVQHEQNFPVETVDAWRKALRRAGKLKGEPIVVKERRYESDVIATIVKVVRDQVWLKIGSDAPKFVGRGSEIARIHSWVQDGSSSSVGVATIYGIGGIGKTSIAREVYNLNSLRFQRRCFLEDVGKMSKQQGLVYFQTKLLQDLWQTPVCPILGVAEGSALIQNIAPRNRVLIILDDVDDVDQYDKLIGDRKRFHPGTKIIITSRVKSILRAHECDETFEIEPMPDDESLVLLSWRAFGQDHPKPGYEECSRDLVHYCGGLPLALETLGSSLSGAPITRWNGTIKHLERNPNRKIQDVLEISYYSLPDDHDKNLFLDVACFFVGVDKDYAVKIFDGCGFSTEVGIWNLMERCLISFNREGKLMMHQLIRDMGWDLARREPLYNRKIPRRVWDNKDFGFWKEAEFVVTNETDIESVKGLWLKLPIISSTPNSTQLRRENSLLSAKAFAKMKNLQLLHLSHVELYEHSHWQRINPTLVWLRWHKFSLTSIPNDLYLEKLAVLDMPYSKLRYLWEGIRHLMLLKVLDLRHSRDLIRTPNFEGLPGLEILVLEGCIKLEEVHESIRVLEKLESLNLKDCKNIRSALPVLKSVKKLIISGCSNLGKYPDVLRHFESLKVLNADGISIKNLREAKLSLMPQLRARSYAQSTRSPFDSFPRSLTSLSLANCSLSDDSFPAELSRLYSLKYLNLGGNPITLLPECIKHLPLDELELERCTELQSLSTVPRKYLNLHACESLVRVENHASLSQYSPGILPVLCPNLAEIGDYFKLEPLGNIDSKVHGDLGLSDVESLIESTDQVNLYNGLTCLTRRTTIQVSSEYGMHSVFLPGRIVPDWFRHPVQGDSISFPLSRMDDHELQGFSLCLKYWLDPQRAKWYPFLPHPREQLFCPGAFGLVINNRTKKQSCRYDPIVRGIPIPDLYEDMLWLSYWNLEDLRYLLPLDYGDEVEVSGHMSGFVAKAWWMHYVYRLGTIEPADQPSPWSYIGLTHLKTYQVIPEQDGYSSSTLITLVTQQQP